MHFRCLNAMQMFPNTIKYVLSHARQPGNGANYNVRALILHSTGNHGSDHSAMFNTRKHEIEHSYE